MEVHHHPDLHHKPKKWKEYFLEFLMIFLAVTMGFIAENIREHITEDKNAKVLAASLLEDIKSDTASLHYTETTIYAFCSSVERQVNVDKHERTTWGFVQAGLDVQTSAVCIAVLWFGLDGMLLGF